MAVLFCGCFGSTFVVPDTYIREKADVQEVPGQSCTSSLPTFAMQRDRSVVREDAFPRIALAVFQLVRSSESSSRSFWMVSIQPRQL